MLQTLKEALSKTVVQASLVAIIVISGLFYARRAQINYEKALKDDAQAQAFHQAADSIKKLSDSLEKVIKVDKARSDSMLTIIRPKVVEHGHKVINTVQVAIKAAQDTGVITIVNHPLPGFPDTTITLPLHVFVDVAKTADSLVAAYEELQFTDSLTFESLGKVQAELEDLHLKDVAVIDLQKKEIKTKDDEINHLKKARTAGKIRNVAIVAGAAVLYLFLHR